MRMNHNRCVSNTVTGITDIAKYVALHDRVHPFILLKINSNCRNWSSGQDVFLKKIVAFERSDGCSGQSCALLLADKSGHLHKNCIMIAQQYCTEKYFVPKG